MRCLAADVQLPLAARAGRPAARDPEEDGSASAFHDYRSVLIRDAGHWVHHDQLDAFMAELHPFLGEGVPATVRVE